MDQTTHNQNEGMNPGRTTRLNPDSWYKKKDRIPHVKEDFRVKDFLRPSDSSPSRPQRVNGEINRANGLLGEIATKLPILQKLVPSKIVEDFKYQVSTIHQDFIKNSQEAIKNYGDFYSRRSHNHREQAFTELEKLNSDLKERYDDLFELEQRLSDIEKIQANKEHVLTTNRQHVDQTIENLIDKFKSAYTELFDKYQPSITETNDGNNPIYKNKVERHLARGNVKQINNIIKEMHDVFITAKKISSDIKEIQDKKDNLLPDQEQIITKGFSKFFDAMEASYDRILDIYSHSISRLRSHSDNRDLIHDSEARQQLIHPMKWLQITLSYVRDRIPDTAISTQREQDAHELQEPYQVTPSGPNPQIGYRGPIVSEDTPGGIQTTDVSRHRSDGQDRLQHVQELAQSFNDILNQITGNRRFIENLPVSNRDKLQSHIRNFFNFREALSNPNNRASYQEAIDNLAVFKNTIQEMHDDLKKFKRICRYLEEIEANMTNLSPNDKQTYTQATTHVSASSKLSYERLIYCYGRNSEEVFLDSANDGTFDYFSTPTIGETKNAEQIKLNNTIKELRILRDKTKPLPPGGELSTGGVRGRRSTQLYRDTPSNQDNRPLSDGRTSQNYDRVVQYSNTIEKETQSLEQWFAHYIPDHSRVSIENKALSELFLKAQGIKAFINYYTEKGQWDDLQHSFDKYDKVHFSIQKAAICVFIAESNNLEQGQLQRSAPQGYRGNEDVYHKATEDVIGDNPPPPPSSADVVRQLQSYADSVYNRFKADQQKASPFYRKAYHAIVDYIQAHGPQGVDEARKNKALRDALDQIGKLYKEADLEHEARYRADRSRTQR